MQKKTRPASCLVRGWGGFQNVGGNQHFLPLMEEMIPSKLEGWIISIRFWVLGYDDFSRLDLASSFGLGIMDLLDGFSSREKFRARLGRM